MKSRPVAPRTIRCPDCREPHTACTLDPCFQDTSWVWFTCGGVRYSFPDTQERLGGKRYAGIMVRDLTMVLGCPNCGQDCKAGASEDLVTFVCYRCGQVGVFVVARRRPSRRARRRDKQSKRLWFSSKSPD